MREKQTKLPKLTTIRIKKQFGGGYMLAVVTSKTGKKLSEETVKIPDKLMQADFNTDNTDIMVFWLTSIERKIASRMKLGQRGKDYRVQY